MENDQQMAIAEDLNLAGAGNLPQWEDDFTKSAHNLSLSENGMETVEDHRDHSLIQKCFDFIKKHARDADPEFVLSLLQSSEVDNPKRLELIMSEILNIPNALELIREFKMSPLKAGDKRCLPDSNSHPEDAKKTKKDADEYLQQLKDMFPDADDVFLLNECRQLETRDDFSRFVNTVMLSGVYPKKGIERCPGAEPYGEVDVINITDHSGVDTSEEEITSSGIKEKKKRKQQKRKKRAADGDAVDVIDLASHDAETYEESDYELREFLGWDPLQKVSSRVRELVTLPDESERLDRRAGGIGDNQKWKFGRMPGNDVPTPGPSGEGSHQKSRASLPGEKSLAEIIEEKKTNRRKSFAMGSGTESKAADPGRRKSVSREATASNGSGDSEGEVSTTSQPTRCGSETDGGPEEGDVNEEWLAEQTANLIRIFPNTDPSYLREEVVKMNGSSEAVNEFVVAKLERNDMPSRAEYEKKLEMEELQNRYTKNFSIEDFLKAVPDPWAYFTQGNRNCAKYKRHSLCYLKSTFRRCYVRDIIDTFNRNCFNLYLTYQDLKREKKRTRTSQRSSLECNHNRPTTIDIQFLQEVAFIENEEKIKDHLEGARLERQIKFDEAKRTGSLLECQCCFDSEVMVEDIFYCPKDHAFCRTCIIRSVEVELGYGRHSFACLSTCEEKFTLPCLQNALGPELFSKVIKAIQMEEIRAAEIEDLVQCPFCSYATIMPPEEKVLTCLNPECLKESCRSCKELNHIPLRCDEVEKSEEIKMRTYIENKMTEALVRTCYKCGKKFVKEDGCNKMTCTCGAKMCYICRKPVSDYSHFNGQGGTEYHKCPLYSTNDVLHVELVRIIGEEAKAEIMQANPNTKLLHDPTIVAPERTNQGSMPGINDGAALDVAMRAFKGTLHTNESDPETHCHARDRREIRREANPHFHRNYLYGAQPESEEEDDYDHRHHHHHHHHHHLHHRHRHNRYGDYPARYPLLN